MLEREAHVVPVEVKAKKGATASLNSMLEREDVQVGHKLSSGNIGVVGKKVTIPLAGFGRKSDALWDAMSEDWASRVT